MAPSIENKKRKAVTRDVPDHVESDLDDSGFAVGLLDGSLSDNADDESHSDEDDDEGQELSVDEDELESLEDEAFGSDEISTDDDELSSTRNGNTKTGNKNGKKELDAGIADIAIHDDTLSDDDTPNYTITEDANGNERYVYKNIDPVYDSDDSDAPEDVNTIGNIPLSFYDSYPHIGYNINGKKIMRPAKGQALDSLLDSIEVPQGWTGLTDPATGKPLELNQDELEILRKIQMNEVPEDGYDPYPATIEYFTSKTEIMPLSSAPEPKRRFIPSKHEAKRVAKIVRAIRDGRIQPYKPPAEQEEEDPDIVRYDVWADEAPRSIQSSHIPAPKLPAPGYDESYNPPKEYLPSSLERKAWEQVDEEDREKEYLPTSYDALRKVPGYDQFLKERFERSLDLYLAPRIRRQRRTIDPESLLPKLPSPDELRPFPTMCATVFRGHDGRVRSLAIDPTGNWLATGGDDGTVRVWELMSGRQVWHVKLASSSEDPVNVVRWRPGPEAFVLAAGVGSSIYMLVPPLTDPTVDTASRAIIDAGWGYAASNPSKIALTTASGAAKAATSSWTRPAPFITSPHVLLAIHLNSPIKVLTFHRRGDYFATVAPSTISSSAVAIHTLSKHLTQLPFRRLKGLPQTTQFHPSKPVLFVATQRSIRLYDLVRQQLLKILQPGARWISSLDIHPGGDNLLVGSYDRRLLWHDLDLSPRPYKTLRYHPKAIRQVKFHQGGLPLFADASDDGTIQVFHGRVVDDLMENATIVPLKVLKGHTVEKQLGVLDLDWHPKEAWVVSAGGDGTCRLWM